MRLAPEGHMSEQEFDRLFELPPEEFTAARNELARRLKDEGNASAAAEVKQLGKPSIAVWAINQLARNEKGAVKLLLESAGRLRKAQENALKGSGSGEALRRAQADERKALRELTEQTQHILEHAGRSAGSTVLDKVSSTLRAAAVDDAGRAALKAGRLTSEVKSSGFDVFAGLELPAKTSRRGAPAPDDQLADRRRMKDERKAKRRQLEKRTRQLAARADEDAEKAERAEAEAGRARKAADMSRREAEAAAAELEAFDR
jgi:hypothetical protein